MVNNLPATWETWVRLLGWEHPLEKGKATHSGILTWRIPLTKEPGKLQFMGSQRVWHYWVTFFTTSTTWEALVICIRLAAAAKSLQSCPTLRPHRRQPTRLPRPWDSPGKNTGVGCHFLLQCMKVKSESEVAHRVRLLATPWTAAHQAPPSMGFSRQEYEA